MKVKSKLDHNVSFAIPHGVDGPDYLTIPAGATLEVADKVYLPFAPPIERLVAAGVLVIVEDVVCTLSAKEIAKAIEEQAGVSVDARKSKADLQSIANKLGVSL